MNAIAVTGTEAKVSGPRRIVNFDATGCSAMKRQELAPAVQYAAAQGIEGHR